jgi:2-polyprenyl-3-methyl-5-hydroxy-6-metoxy-1,4-benzoquinol methylase
VSAPDSKPNSRVVIRHSKPLDIRSHKQDWLNIEYLRSKRQETLSFCQFVLSNQHRISIDRCYICRGKEREPFATTYGIPYFRCSECGHVYAGVVLSPEELSKYYLQQYFAGAVYVDEGQLDRRKYMVYEPKVRFVMDFLRGSRRKWLDVGAGNGSIVACAAELGFDAAGLEPGTPAVEFAQRTLGVKLYPHTIEEELQRSGSGSYDVVSFFMVLEHVSNPVEQVSVAAELLSSGGLLVVEVPTAGSLSAMLDGLFPNQGLRQLVGAHIMLYSVQSATRLVEDCGCQTEGMWFMGQDIFNLFIHLALHNSMFLKTAMADFLLDNNNALQEVVDRSEFCDEVVIVARKGP